MLFNERSQFHQIHKSFILLPQLEYLLTQALILLVVEVVRLDHFHHLGNTGRVIEHRTNDRLLQLRIEGIIMLHSSPSAFSAVLGESPPSPLPPDAAFLGPPNSACCIPAGSTDAASVAAFAEASPSLPPRQPSPGPLLSDRSKYH